MKKCVNYKVEKEEWVKAIDKAFNKLNKTAKIDGFRPGKAPRNKFEQKYGKQELIIEAANELIDKKYYELMQEKDINPVIEPKVDLVKADENELEVNFTFIMAPVVKLGEYKNLGIKKEEAKVTKDEIEHELGHLLEHYAEISTKEGKVENGNIAVIDFEGFKDGVAFEGGKAENYQLEIGSNSFIPGFEEGIIGMSKGEEKDLNLTFPKDYQAEDLKGAKVVFKVKVNDIKERVIPKLDEDFFKDLDMENITNEKELKEMLSDEIKANKERNIENKYIDDLLKKASDNMTIDLEEELIDSEVDRMYDDFVNRMSMQGITEELYFQYANTTKEKVREEMREEATNRLKYRYLLNEVAKAEKIKVTDKDAEKEAERLAKEYNMEKDAFVEEFGGIEVVKYDLMMRKALEVLKEN